MTIEDEYFDLLDQELSEQIYQSFLENNTRFIPREFVQNHGIHLDLVLRKLSLSRDYIPDFFYLSKSSADWNCIFIEIEKPQSKYFVKGTCDFHEDFSVGLDQINRWKAWFNNDSNRLHLINGTLENYRTPLESNKCYIKYILVHGRRAEFVNNSNRIRRIEAIESDDFKIMTFDSLAESIHSKNDLYLGVRKNEHYEIRSDKYISDAIFSFIPSDKIRINQKLKDDIVANKDKWRSRCIDNIKKFHLEKVLGDINIYK